jgi:RNA polymerase sigma factor (sigma-70 family)
MSQPPLQNLIDEHADAVFRFLCALAGRQRAEDLFKETFLSALRAYPRLKDASNLRAWLFRIAQHKVIDEHRRNARRPVPIAELPEAPTCGREEPDESLWQALDALPAKQRLAVLHRFVGDLTYRDVAGALGISKEAARRNVHKRINKLREVWS